MGKQLLLRIILGIWVLKNGFKVEYQIQNGLMALFLKRSSMQVKIFYLR